MPVPHGLTMNHLTTSHSLTYVFLVTKMELLVKIRPFCLKFTKHTNGSLIMLPMDESYLLVDKYKCKGPNLSNLTTYFLQLK